MLPSGVPSKTRLPLVLYKGLLRKAKLFDRYPILKAYCNNPLKRGTLYIPSLSFHEVIKSSFRQEEHLQFDMSKGFKMFREWNDIYASVSKKITWYNQSLPASSKKKEPVVKHIKNIIPGSVLISHPAVFEKNEGSQIVLILQRNEYETMALLIQGRDLRADEEDSNSLFTPQEKRKNSFADLGPALSSEPDFAEDLKDFDDENIRKVLIVDSDIDQNSEGPYSVSATVHKITVPVDKVQGGKGGAQFANSIAGIQFTHSLSHDYEGDYGYDAYDYMNLSDDYDVDAGEDDLVARDGSNGEVADDEDDGVHDYYDYEYQYENYNNETDYDDDGDRDLDQIADDGRGKENNPTIMMKEEPKEIPNPVSPLLSNQNTTTKPATSAVVPSKQTPITNTKEDIINSKTVYKGGERYPAKYVVVYTKANKSKLEGEWLSDNLFFEVFSSIETMKKSKIVTLPSQQYRIFQGYHLFQTETLEKQVADGAYFVCHTPLEILHFDNNLDKPLVLSTEEIWSKILMEMGGEFSHFAYSRKSPMEKVTE
jgi:putative AlgH/UPF0301 family transcriptional regulator